MFGALISFLGGSAFRMVWGEVSSWLTARQDHVHEVEKMRLQGELDAAQHGRNLEAQKLQADLGIKTIGVQAESDVARLEMGAWAQAVGSAVDSKDVSWSGQWTKAIRPAAATIALLLWSVSLARHGFAIEAWDRELIGSVLGFFFADRSLANRGK